MNKSFLIISLIVCSMSFIHAAPYGQQEVSLGSAPAAVSAYSAPAIQTTLNVAAPAYSAPAVAAPILAAAAPVVSSGY